MQDRRAGKGIIGVSRYKVVSPEGGIRQREIIDSTYRQSRVGKITAQEIQMDRQAGEPLDKSLTCSDCGATFTFTAGEQLFYESKGLSVPKRCPDCRARRRATINPAREGGR